MVRYQATDGVFQPAEHFSEECLRHYQCEGWVLLKGFYDTSEDLIPIHREVNQLVNLKLNEMGVKPDADSLDTISNRNFLSLCGKNRDRAGEIYRATRHFQGTHQLLVKERNLALAKLLMNTDYVNVIPYVPLRIDIKGEEKYLFDWHQDYPYTQGSMDGIVIWAPLFDVFCGEGGVKFIPQSHKKGVHPVIVNDKENMNKNGAHSIRIANPELFEKQQAYSMDVMAGDALVFSTLLVHKSLPLTRGDIRWTTQLRYGNFNDLDSIKRGWPGGMIEGNWFEKDHPEFVITERGK